jgi:hypothetical protein
VALTLGLPPTMQSAEVYREVWANATVNARARKLGMCMVDQDFFRGINAENEYASGEAAFADQQRRAPGQDVQHWCSPLTTAALMHVMAPRHQFSQPLDMLCMLCSADNDEYKSQGFGSWREERDRLYSWSEGRAAWLSQQAWQGAHRISVLLESVAASVRSYSLLLHNKCADC